MTAAVRPDTNTSSGDAPTTADPNFEQTLAELDRIVRDLEEGQIGLEDALARYERGVGLLRHGHQLLGRAEQRILVLTAVDANGQAILEPFGPEADARSRAAMRRPPRSNAPPSNEEEGLPFEA